MSTSRLLDVINEYRRLLSEREANAVQALEAAYAQTLNVIKARLATLYDEMDTLLQTGEEIPRSWLYEAGRLENLTQFINYQVQLYSSLAHSQVMLLQQSAAHLGVQSAQQQLQALTPKGITWTWGMPSARAIERLIGATQKGSPLADLFAGFGREAAKSVAEALVTGVTLGQNPRKVAPLVERALDVPRWRALTIARTEQLRAFRGGNQETYRANDSVVQQWRWTAAKSARTCAACLAMDGTLHKLSEEMGSHPSCRCTPIPITKSWDDLLGPLGIDTSNIPESRPVNMQTGSEWLDAQSEKTQRKVLGPKYEGWKNNEFSLKDLVGHSHDKDWGHSIYEKSLKQLSKGA